MLSLLLHRIVNTLGFVGCGDSVATINSAVVMRKQLQTLHKQMKSQGSVTQCVNQAGQCREVSEFVCVCVCGVNISSSKIPYESYVQE